MALARALLASLAILTAGLSPSGRATASGGALPKGSVSIDRDKAKAPPAAPAERDLSCFASFLRPLGGNGLFADGALYLLGQSSAIRQAAGKERPGARHTLFRVKLVATPGAAEALLSLEHQTSVALAAYGTPVTAVSAVGFTGPKLACGEGPADVVSITLAKGNLAKEQAVRASGSYSFVDTPDGRRLADEKKRTLLEMDPETFQTKAVRRLAQHERGLFYDPGTRTFVAWHDDGKLRGLVRYKSDDDGKPRRLALVKGDRVLQQGGRFAVGRTDGAANTVRIQELDDWSGRGSPGIFTIKLPKPYKVDAAGVDLHLDKRIAVVYPVGYAAQRAWRRVMVYDYGSAKILGVLSVRSGALPGYVGIDPTGSYVVAEMRDDVSRRTTGLQVFDVATRKTRDVVLNAP